MDTSQRSTYPTMAPSKVGGNFWLVIGKFPSLFALFHFPLFRLRTSEQTQNSKLPPLSISSKMPLLCRYSAGLGIAQFEVMLNQLKRRWHMSPLMSLMLITLVPFPILALVILVDRWVRSNHEAIP